MPSPEPWTLRIDPDVLRNLERIPKGDARRVLLAIKALPANPYCGDIQKMKGQENTWRRRVGSYRFFYKLIPNGRIILVFHLERRTSTTY